MRAVLALITVAVVVAFLAALILLRGCQNKEVTSEEAAVESPASEDVAAESEISAANAEDQVAASIESVEESTTAGAEGGTSPSATQTKPAVPATEKPAGRTSAAKALSTARSAAGKADQISDSDPGKAFQLFAEAFAAVSAHPADAACQQLASSLRPKIERTAARANAGISATSDKTLIEQ